MCRFTHTKAPLKSKVKEYETIKAMITNHLQLKRMLTAYKTYKIVYFVQKALNLT